MNAIVEKKSGRILGAAILGTERGYVMSVLQMAMRGGVTHERIRKGGEYWFMLPIAVVFSTIPTTVWTGFEKLEGRIVVPARTRT